ncbi:hypothetical protein FPRO04_14650, partial [Fusarium proliferatum]
MDNAMSMTRPPVTQLRPLHTDQQSTETSQRISWTSSVQPRPDEETTIKAFVKLVSHLVVLDEDENFCIQDTKREHQVHLKADASIIPTAALGSLGCMLDDIIIGVQQGHSARPEWTQPSVLNFPPRPEPLPLTHDDETLTDDVAKISLLHHQFERCAAESPERVAIDYLTDLENGHRMTFTYRQIANAATTLAGKIAKACEGSTQSLKTVAVLIGPYPELYISYLAALKTGVAFCPIAVDAPAERQQALMAHFKQPALLRTTSLPEPELSSLVTSCLYLAHCSR